MGDELNQGHNSVLDDSNLAIIMLTNFILKNIFSPGYLLFRFRIHIWVSLPRMFNRSGLFYIVKLKTFPRQGSKKSLSVPAGSLNDSIDSDQ